MFENKKITLKFGRKSTRKKQDKALRPIPFFIVCFLKQSWLKDRRNTCSEILFQLLNPNTDKKLQKPSRNLNYRRLKEYGISPCFFAVSVDYAYSHIIICPGPKIHYVKLSVCEFSVFINNNPVRMHIALQPYS